MFERLKVLYSQNKINATQLDVAVSKGWITDEQKQLILNS